MKNMTQPKFILSKNRPGDIWDGTVTRWVYLIHISAGLVEQFRKDRLV
jgi:hypothetical protein